MALLQPAVLSRENQNTVMSSLNHLTCTIWKETMPFAALFSVY